MAKVEIRAIAITVSDTRRSDNDISGDTLAECLKEIGATIVERIIVTDDYDNLVETLHLGSQKANLVVTTGGTGFTPRDHTPEATRAVIEREAPGLAEAMRSKSLEITPRAMLSRAVCGIKGKCLIVNLPGSPKGVKECFAILKPILSHAIDLIEGDAKH